MLKVLVATQGGKMRAQKPWHKIGSCQSLARKAGEEGWQLKIAFNPGYGPACPGPWLEGWRALSRKEREALGL